MSYEAGMDFNNLMSPVYYNNNGDCYSPRKSIINSPQYNSDFYQYPSSRDGTIHFKILVPSVAAGAIIGKGGETIAQLQKEAGARVKMSKANDFYPGTSERVCLITGSLDAVVHVLAFIMEKIKEKPDPNAKPAIDFDNKMMAERDKQVKVLVPNSTAGMIIGKAGNYIKQIKEESGSYVQISQKARDQTLAERCITVIGDQESNNKACMMILTKVMEDPQSGSCLNVSYADITGPVANFNPTGSPFASQGGATSPVGPQSMGGMGTGEVMNTPGMLLNSMNLHLNLTGGSSGPGSTMVTNQLLEHIHTLLRSSGYSEHATNEITTAMSTLANYGILGAGYQGPVSPCQASQSMAGMQSPVNSQVQGVNSLLGTALSLTGAMQGALHHSSMQQSDGHDGANGQNSMFGPIGSVSTSTTSPRSDKYGPARVTTDNFDPFRHSSSSNPYGGSSLAAGGHNMPVVNNNSYGLGTQQNLASLSKSPPPPPPPPDSTKLMEGMSKYDMEIGEYIVGAILGPGGRNLVEIQHLSGATIQISKKGTFAPGTRNRIVTICGTPQAISTAQYLIEQRISEEEVKRARQSSVGASI